MSHRSNVRPGSLARRYEARTAARVSRRAAGVVALLSFLQVGLVCSHVDASPKACAAVYEQGQRLSAASRFVDAAAKFRYCGGPACPKIMHAECMKFLDEVEAATPSIVVSIEPEGEAAARFSVNEGAEKAVDGRPILLDPGPHVVRASAPGYEKAERRFILSAGEKLKRIEIRLARVPIVTEPPTLKRDTPAVPAAESVERRPNWLPWIFASTFAAAGAAGFAYWGVTARSNETELDRCRPGCAQSQVDGVKRDYLLSNVSLGVGLSGVAAMAVWFAIEPDKPAPRASGGARVLPAVSIAGASSLTLTLPF